VGPPAAAIDDYPGRGIGGGGEIVPLVVNHDQVILP